MKKREDFVNLNQLHSFIRDCKQTSLTGQMPESYTYTQAIMTTYNICSIKVRILLLFSLRARGIR